MAEFPQELTAALEQLLAGRNAAQLAKDAQAISENYRLRTGAGNRLLTREGEAAAYAASRMPATFAAAHAALEAAIAASGLSPRTLMDCGAGTGAATWAAADLLNLEGATCLEREDAMRSVGSALMRSGGGVLDGARWESCDLTAANALPKAELVIEGYMLGELKEEMRTVVAKKLWDACTQMLLLIEPGTPQGFANLACVRRELAALGAHVAAPCPADSDSCPMTDGDWCHFSVRVQRTRLHKALKGGDAPYEDEKFCYLALTRNPPENACAARVLRHPLIQPGRITLTLCEGGEKKLRAVTKKDALWKRARKIGAGERV
ncbi:MAG: rRNA methyltransferase [Clostridia bacterium]|nr:rRNA methyltransferase [Clostridia bacterium]